MQRLSPSNTIDAIQERTCAALCVYGICAILAMACTAGPELELDLPAGSIGREVIAPNSLLFNSLGANGINVNGINVNGINVNGINVNGVSLNGINVNGVSVNGVSVNGVSVNGINVNGVSVNGVSVNGLGLSGVALDGIALTEARVSGLALNPSTAENVELLLGYLTECALLSGQCITVHALDGTPLTLCGAEGIDRGWGSGLPDLARAGAMGTCVLDRATTAGQSASFTPVNIQAFKRVLQYMVECALDEGESVTIYDENNAPVNYYGSLGLAKHWASQPLSATGQLKVSACLAARSNALQQPVQISLRGAGLHTQSTEIDLYPTHEGAFWADLFASQPYVNTCLVTGGGLSGRVCADGDECGFMRTGDCATVCRHQSSDGSYTDCAGSGEVVNTFLALGSQIRFGARHLCMTQMDGSLWCKGDNSSGELGTGTVSEVEQAMMPVAALGQSVAESGGGEAFSCARKRDGTLWCWGKNNHGQLGDGTSQDRAVPAQITALGSDVASFGLSHGSGCAHTTDGTLWCWGKNDHGQLGDGTSQDRLSPVKVSDLGDQVAGVSTGSHSATTCSVLNDGSVWCWGKNDRGQLGDGTTASKNRPVQVATNERGQPFGGVTEVCTGVAHTCARAADGKVWCWGDDRRGQLGDDQRAAQNPQSRPVRVKLSGKVAPNGLTCGEHHTCAVNENGSLWCWGDNSSGALGDGTYTNRTRPVPVTSLGNEVMQATAASERSCALMIDGSVFCWGRDDTGVLFPGTTPSTPVEVSLSAP